MNIRKKLIFSFFILMLFILSVEFLSLISTYQIREDTEFATQVSDLIKIQENMNEAINLAVYENEIKNLEKIKSDFQGYEVSFENLERVINMANQKDWVDFILEDSHQNQEIKISLSKLFDNERVIEDTFSNIYQSQSDKLDKKQVFENRYKEENDRRVDLQKLIFETGNGELIQEFGNLKYYSKETLYQHKDQKRLSKWLDSIDTIIKKLKEDEHLNKGLLGLFEQYRDIVKFLGEIVIEINVIEVAENDLIKGLKKTLENNRQESIVIEEKINKATEAFLDNISITQIISFIIIIVFAIILTYYIYSRLSKIIKKLSLGARTLKEGAYDTRILIDEDQEFNEIAITFNEMAKNIKEHKENLEEKIQQRTIELQEAVTAIHQQKELLESLSNKLAKYLSPQVFESIFSGKQDVVLESKRKYLTVFFSDIKGFTELTDTVETEALTQILNEYLDIMSGIVIKYGGTIDKYIGDSIMVFFGDPATQGKTQDAMRCIKMAIEMKEEMSRLRIKWRNDGISKPFHIRMGINSGYCTVGNFGSKNRLDYTIIGGVVNIASRLESQANPDQILMSSETYILVKDEIACLKKEEILVKGISHAIQTYEAIAERENKTIIEEQHGFNLIIDLNEIPREQAVAILEKHLMQVKNVSIPASHEASPT